jgi:hypothetical protein
LNKLFLYTAAAGALKSHHDAQNNNDGRKGNARAAALEDAKDGKQHDDADGDYNERTGHVVETHAPGLWRADGTVFNLVFINFFVHME